jgi:hypothetical protein
MLHPLHKSDLMTRKKPTRGARRRQPPRIDPWFSQNGVAPLTWLMQLVGDDPEWMSIKP